MKGDKKISGQTVRKNPEEPKGRWDILDDAEAVVFTGTMEQVKREAARIKKAK